MDSEDDKEKVDQEHSSRYNFRMLEVKAAAMTQPSCMAGPNSKVEVP